MTHESEEELKRALWKILHIQIFGFCTEIQDAFKLSETEITSCISMANYNEDGFVNSEIANKMLTEIRADPFGTIPILLKDWKQRVGTDPFFNAFMTYRNFLSELTQ